MRYSQTLFCLAATAAVFLTTSCDSGSSGASASGTVNSGPATSNPIGAVQPAPSPVPTGTTSSSGRLYGVTLDDVSNLSEITTALSQLSRKATARIVFDEKVSASQYSSAVQQIGSVADVMGEILDSQYVKTYSNSAYSQRVTEYLNAFSGKVKIWEVGNEINGEWLGTTSDVVTKVTDAYHQVKTAGQTTALTLYYNQDCWSSADHEMFTWTEANIPADMKAGLDYVLISYYEEDCNNLKPDWPTVFAKLGTMFPNSKIGFGETGTTTTDKVSYMQRYYGLNITQPNYIGGYFWWYFAEDALPLPNSFFNALSTAMGSN